MLVANSKQKAGKTHKQRTFRLSVCLSLLNLFSRQMEDAVVLFRRVLPLFGDPECGR